MPVIGGAPLWAPLGGSTGTCYNSGCGFTDWVQADFSILASGNYLLEFGVTNWSDTHFDSGLAFSGATIAGNPIDTSVVPLPTAAWLFGSALGLAGALRRRG